MKVVLDLSRLLREGRISQEEFDRLSRLAAHDTGSLAINILLHPMVRTARRYAGVDPYRRCAGAGILDCGLETQRHGGGGAGRGVAAPSLPYRRHVRVPGGSIRFPNCPRRYMLRGTAIAACRCGRRHERAWEDAGWHWLLGLSRSRRSGWW